MSPQRSQASSKVVKPKGVPPDQTHAECYYYAKQIQNKTPMVIVFRDGEAVEGVIEWYDKCCLRLARANGPSLLIYKPSIMYMYKNLPPE